MRVYRLFSVLAKADVVVEKFSEGDESRGYYVDGVIHLNAKKVSDSASVYVAIHEVVHHLKANNEKGYSVLEKYITNYLSNKGHNVDRMVKSLQKSRQKYGEKLSYEDALEELVCNTMSEIATDEDAMATFLELNESERKTLISVLRDIANKIREWARSLTGKEYRRLVTESETLRHLANELNKQLKAVEGNVEQTGQPKYLIMKDINGDIFVEVEEDILEGRPLGEKLSVTLAKIISDRFNNRIIANGQMININATTNKEWRRSPYSQKLLRKGEILIYDNKQRALANADELLITARNWVGEKNEHLRNDDIQEFARGEVKFRTPDGKGYYADVLVATKKSGSVILYDIINLKEIEITAEPTADLSENSRRISETTVIEDNISQPAKPVKKNSFADEIDTAYMRAARSGDTETAQRLVDEAAKRAGYTLKRYHQTEYDFTEFDTERKGAGRSDELLPSGIYLKSTDSDIGLRGKKQMSLYVKTENTLRFTDRQSASEYWKNNIDGYSEIMESIKSIDTEYKRRYEQSDAEADRKYSELWKKRRSGEISETEYQAEIEESSRLSDALLEEWGRVSDEKRAEAKTLIDNYLRTSEYDSVAVAIDEGSFGRKTDTLIVFDSTKVKTADTITYDDNGEVIPLSQRFDESKTDIRYSRDDFSVDYSDLSVLDDEQLDAYNKRGWARDLFTAEDHVLLNQRMGEIFRPNSQYVRSTLADGTVVLDLNNKVLLVFGGFGNESIFGVFSVSATSETYGEYIKGVIYDEIKHKKHNRRTIADFLKTLQRVSEEDDIRFYDGRDYFYHRGKFDSGERATLPDNWQNYGYTTDKQDGRGVSEGSESGISRTDSLSKKRKYSYADEEVDLWGMLEPEEETAESTQRSEYLEGFVQTAATILEKTRGVTLADGRMRGLANNVIRRYTGKYNTPLAQQVEDILTVATANQSVSGYDVVGEIAAVMKKAITESEYTVDRFRAEREDVFNIMRGNGKVYLNDEHTNKNGQSFDCP